ncbi:hypothetical protein B0H16DRAFT_1718664 [Mycena metata]|uniref:Uncharacterized protein n=1 Tax=Mycena metata TaxID=1033252 RepID=A0AAD7JHD9_9AGAR|nr:hypothetical protein B0H16DRAFT_1718664 [Mycena metata]
MLREGSDEREGDQDYPFSAVPFLISVPQPPATTSNLPPSNPFGYCRPVFLVAFNQYFTAPPHPRCSQDSLPPRWYSTHQLSRLRRTIERDPVQRDPTADRYRPPPTQSPVALCQQIPSPQRPNREGVATTSAPAHRNSVDTSARLRPIQFILYSSLTFPLDGFGEGANDQGAFDQYSHCPTSASPCGQYAPSSTPPSLLRTPTWMIPPRRPAAFAYRAPSNSI